MATAASAPDAAYVSAGAASTFYSAGLERRYDFSFLLYNYHDDIQVFALPPGST